LGTSFTDALALHHAAERQEHTLTLEAEPGTQGAGISGAELRRIHAVGDHLDARIWNAEGAHEAGRVLTHGEHGPRAQ
jgi:hypothetical protein